MTAFLDDVATQLGASDLVALVVAARDYLMGHPLPVQSARAMLEALEKLDGQYAALCIVGQIVDESGFDEIDARENRIRAIWRKRLTDSG